jgi:translocation and assembly module TamB
LRHLGKFLTATTLSAGIGATTVLAQQDDNSERGRLEALIEDNLSGENFGVDIVGFQGALSSQATVEELILSDAEGPWLTLRGVTLDWNRAALLRGRVSVDELIAEEILVPRLPQGGETTEVPDAQAQPFSLPELPVSVQIGRIAAERVELGEPVIGVEAVLALEGSASLAGGEGDVSLSIDRLDRGGEISLEGSYANETNVLSLDLSLDEPEGGIAATLIGLPGTPPVALSVEGEGPLSDFAADLQLATDGEDRLTGRVAVAALEGDVAGTGFSADVQGDIRPLLTPENREFFGADLSLDVAGQSLESGALTIDTLELASEAININGFIALGPDKWPERIDLTGDIAGRDGAPIQLPIPGEVTRVDRADLNVQYDAETGDAWQAELAVTGLDRPTLSAERLSLDGSGTLIRGEGTAVGEVDGRFDIATEALAFADPSLAEAVGTTLSGILEFDYREGEPLSLTQIALDGAGIAIDGALDITGLTDELNIAIEGDVNVETSDIARFSGLAGRELSGGARLSASGSVEPLSGAFDAELDGTVNDLVTGIAEADRLLDGQTELLLSAQRDEQGILLRQLEVSAPEANLTASGGLGAETGNADISLRVAELSEILPELQGALSFDGTARKEGESWQVSGDVAGPGGAEAIIDAALEVVEGQLRAVGGTLDANVADLSAYSEIAGRPLGGAADISAEGSADLELNTVSVAASGDVTDPITGIAEVDRLLAGNTTFSVDGAKTTDGYLLRDLDVTGQRLSATAEGAYRPEDSGLRFDVRLDDLADVVPTMSGSANVTGRADQMGDNWDIVLDAAGPGGLTADIDATAALEEMVPQSVRGDVSLSVNTLRPYEGLVGRSLSGSVDATASGDYDFESGAGQVTLDAEAGSIVTGIAPVDQLLRGGVTDLAFRGGRQEDGTLVIESLDLDAPQISADANGTFNPDSGVAEVTLDAEARNPVTGIEAVDQLLRGGVTDLQFRGGRLESGAFRIDSLNLDAPQIDATASGNYGANGGQIEYDVRLANVGLFVPEFNGPATAQGTAANSGGDWRVNAALTAPGNTSADVSGTVAADASTLNLDINGSAPLGLANPFLEPNLIGGIANFDLSVNGPPGLDALSGQIVTQGAQFTIPNQGIALENIGAQVSLNGGQANIELQGDVATGGDINVTGPVTLSPPFNGDLTITLDDVIVEDPGLYQTDVDGTLTLVGPLASTATLSGQIDLDQTEVRIPSGGGIQTLGFPIDHVNESAAVRLTRQRAGLIESPNEGGSGGSGGGVNYRLDLLINAPSRIFIRGRGLDAEVGGQLRIGGTIQNVVPQGRFDLIRGRLDILGQRIELDEASVSIEGDFNPFVTVVAETQSGDTQIRVTISGPASDPEVTFSSTPDRPQEEVLALLLFGRDLSEISAFQALRIAAAINTLTGGGPGITETLRANTGLDNLDLQTAQDGTTSVSVGKYIGENLYTDVTVSSSGETDINLNLDITDSITARGTVTSTGNTGVGIYYERDY